MAKRLRAPVATPRFTPSGGKDAKLESSEQVPAEEIVERLRRKRDVNLEASLRLVHAIQSCVGRKVKMLRTKSGFLQV